LQERFRIADLSLVATGCAQANTEEKVNDQMSAANLHMYQPERPLVNSFREATRLHSSLLKRYWTGRVLEGPDPGVRFNYRIGRVIKSYLPWVRWGDACCYMQAQGYWIIANWRLFTMTGAAEYREIALRCSHAVIQRQRSDGAWDYPNPEWAGRVATIEGTWGCLGLLESYRQAGEPAFLDSIQRWHDFLIRSIGFLQMGDRLAVNYFAEQTPVAAVPNNSVTVLRFFAELGQVTGDDAFLAPCGGLLRFLKSVQKENGEFPYALQHAPGAKTREHFQCYQYHGFMCLDLIKYYECTGDQSVLPLISKVLSFLRNGIGGDGHAFYQCGNEYRRVTYHTAAVAAAFLKAYELGMEGYEELACRAYSYLLKLQRPDGDFPHSRGEYRLFSDRRSYPRQLAMILLFLMEPNSQFICG
jgi:hypothetical protein